MLFIIIPQELAQFTAIFLLRVKPSARPNGVYSWTTYKCCSRVKSSVPRTDWYKIINYLASSKAKSIHLPSVPGYGEESIFCGRLKCGEKSHFLGYDSIYNCFNLIIIIINIMMHTDRIINPLRRLFRWNRVVNSANHSLYWHSLHIKLPHVTGSTPEATVLRRESNRLLPYSIRVCT